MQGISISPRLIDALVKDIHRDVERMAIRRRVRLGNWRRDCPVERF